MILVLRAYVSPCLATLLVKSPVTLLDKMATCCGFSHVGSC
jgi:hypothetical protein